MQDIRSVLLGVVSLGLVATWTYHLYDKNKYRRMAETPREVYVVDTAAIAHAIQDSMRRIYAESLAAPDSLQIAPDSLRVQLDKRLSEIFELRERITTILQNKNATTAELREARTLIRELQVKVDDFKTENNSLEGENSRLTEVLGGLNSEIKGLKDTIQKLDLENKQLNESVDLATTFVASEIRLAAMNIKGRDREVQTTNARKVDKLVVSFIVQNNITSYDNSEIVTIITDPDNKIVANPIWDSGTFATRYEGQKAFTRKVKFEYKKGEQKRLIFSLETEKYKKGNYTISIYHNGINIGESNVALN